MGEPGAVVITLMIDKYLSFILQPSKGSRMYYSVTVSLVYRSIGMFLFLVNPAPGIITLHGERGKEFIFPFSNLILIEHILVVYTAHLKIEILLLYLQQ